MNHQNDLLGVARYKVRRRELSRKTENAYLNHIRRFLNSCAAGESAAARVEKASVFLEKLQKTCSASTRRQARSALLFFFREVLGQNIPENFASSARPRKKARTRVVFTHREIGSVLANMQGASSLVAALIYGSGLRLPEAVSLRVRDLDFANGEIVVRCARTGARERTTVLPRSIVGKLKRHLHEVKYTHEDDLLFGFGRVFLPERIYHRTPEAAYDWGWQYVFPAVKLSRGGGVTFRHHLAESTVQKAVAEAIEKAKLARGGCCQALRYSFAARLFERNCSVHTIHNLLGHKQMKTTLSYLNPLGFGGKIAFSPLDA